MAKIINNTLLTKGMAYLLLFKEKCTSFVKRSDKARWRDYALFGLKNINPNTVVGLNGILKKLEKAKLGDYGNDVGKILTTMEAW